MKSKEQDIHIAVFRREGIKRANLGSITNGSSDFMRERKPKSDNTQPPVMCMGCDKFLSKSFKPRHQPNCTGKGINTFVPVAAIAKTPSNFNDFEDGYKAILNTLHQDAVGDYIKTDQIILMVGARSYSSIKRKLDKVQENKRTVRSRIRLMARVYLAFLECYNLKQVSSSQTKQIMLQTCTGERASPCLSKLWKI